MGREEMNGNQLKMALVVGARPNFMKIAPLIKAIQQHNQSPKPGLAEISYILVHTGQHYDIEMSKSFFRDLGIPDPDINLEVGSSTHAVQTANIMMKFERICLERKPDWVLVFGMSIPRLPQHWWPPSSG